VEMHLRPNCPMGRNLRIELEFFRENLAKQKGSGEAAFFLSSAPKDF